MEILHIKTKDGIIYKPQEVGIKDESKVFKNFPVCNIKKLSKGKFQVDYFDEDFQWENKKCLSTNDGDTPNVRLVLYPSGIEEIKYKY